MEDNSKELDLTQPHWFATRFLVNRPLMLEWLNREGVQWWRPCIGTKPLVSSLVLLHCPLRTLLQMKEFFYGYLMVYRQAEGYNPAPLADSEVENFRHTLELLGEDVIVLPKADEEFLKGDRVRVLSGQLAGTEGVVKRVKGDRRLVVSLSGVVAVATAFINPKDLEKI